MSSSQLQTWHTVFKDSEDSDKDPGLLRLYSDFVQYLIRNLRETLGAMTRLASDCSESFVVCLDLVRSYAGLLEEAGAVRPDRRSEGEGTAVAMPGGPTKGAVRPAITA